MLFLFVSGHVPILRRQNRQIHFWIRQPAGNVAPNRLPCRLDFFWYVCRILLSTFRA
jgi:hypothetical protein